MGRRTTRANSDFVGDSWEEGKEQDHNNMSYDAKAEVYRANVTKTTKIDRFRAALAPLADWAEEVRLGLETPIQKLMFESSCK